MTCPQSEELAAFLEGELSANKSRAIESHLTDCSRCREEQERLASLVATMRQMREGDDAQFASDVMARLPSHHARPTVRWLAALTVPAAAMLLFWVAPWRATRSERGVPLPRGGEVSVAEPATHLGVEVLLHRGSAPDERVLVRGGETLHAGDGLTFVVHNRLGREASLGLFAVDSAGRVHWFYPEYSDAAQDPILLTVKASPAVQPLAQGVTPERLAPGPLTLVALFLAQPTTVSQVERAVAQRGLSHLSDVLPVLVQETQSVSARVD